MVESSEYHDDIFNLLLKVNNNLDAFPSPLVFQFLSRASTAQRLYNLSRLTRHHTKSVQRGWTEPGEIQSD